MISVIVIVKNDRKIENVLEGIKGIISAYKTETIVVDASEGALDDIKRRFPDVEWIYFHNSNNLQSSIPEQRNIGLNTAKGEIVIFIDSDCIPDTNWLTEIIKPIKEENEFIVAGRVINSDKNSLHSVEFDKNLDKKYLGEAPTMNLALHRKVIEDVGLFDTNFQCGEDVDFLWRAIQKGYKIRLASNAIIYHDLGDNKKELRRMITYGAARVQLYRKHLYRIKYFIGDEIFKILYPLFFIFLPVSIRFPLYLLLLIPFIYLNIKSDFATTIKRIQLKTLYGIGILYGFFRSR